MTHEFPRRAFLIGGSAVLLVACAPSGPGSVTIVAQGAAGMNPGPDGADRPLTLQVLQLRGAGAFDGADFFGLQNASAALGGDLAYWYARNGALTGIGVATAQQIIGAPGFGADAQGLREFSGLQEGLVRLG